ncbi:MAG: class I SAM-dependent methyltransferase [Nitrospirae bacterium]|nr:class I SAM-dependent methyltransferase [Nitrospirota bacterium]
MSPDKMMAGEVDQFYLKYFKDKFRQFGDTPQGVDWKDKESQVRRFKYIMDTIQFSFPSLKSFSVMEVGCGYGAFFEFLKATEMNNDIAYFGIDLVDEMVTEAAIKYPELKNNLYVGEFKSFSFGSKYDVVISSGIFNVKGHIDDSTFEKHIFHTVELMFALCEKGIFFNLMTPSPSFKDPKLYYPAMDVLFDFICRKLGRKMTIVTSYPLWEITVGILK